MEKLTEAIGGDAVSISVMVPEGIEPHDFEPRAGDLIRLKQARVFVYNGMGMEHWAEKALQSAGAENQVVVRASERWSPSPWKIKKNGKNMATTIPIPGWACLKRKKRPVPSGTASSPPPRKTETSS